MGLHQLITSLSELFTCHWYCGYISPQTYIQSLLCVVHFWKLVYVFSAGLRSQKPELRVMLRQMNLTRVVAWRTKGRMYQLRVIYDRLIFRGRHLWPINLQKLREDASNWNKRGLARVNELPSFVFLTKRNDVFMLFNIGLSSCTKRALRL